MSPNYVCYVKFNDTSETRVSPASDVRDLDPAHSDDFDKEKDYDIFWQEGTKSFDGYFQGRILCMAGMSTL